MLRARQQRETIRFLEQARDFSVLQRVENGSVPHTVLYLMNNIFIGPARTAGTRNFAFI